MAGEVFELLEFAACKLSVQVPDMKLVGEESRLPAPSQGKENDMGESSIIPFQ